MASLIMLLLVVEKRQQSGRCQNNTIKWYADAYGDTKPADINHVIISCGTSMCNYLTITDWLLVILFE